MGTSAADDVLRTFLDDNMLRGFMDDFPIRDPLAVTQTLDLNGTGCLPSHTGIPGTSSMAMPAFPIALSPLYGQSSLDNVFGDVVSPSRKRSGSGNSFAEETACHSNAPEEASNAKRQKDTAPLYQRQKAHQEKNKRAQKRYRDRKRQQAEEQKTTIEQLSAQIQDLTVSKSRLESRCQLLEKVVGLREQTAAPALSSALVPAAEVPEHVRAIGAFIAAIYPGQGVEQNLTSDHIDRFTASDYQRVWEGFTTRLIKLMLHADADKPTSTAYREVIQLIEAHRWGVTALLAHNPAKMLRVAYELRSTKFRRDGCPSRDQQQRVLEGMGLSMDQKQQIVQNRRTLLLSMQQILRTRDSVIAVLQQGLPAKYDDITASQEFIKATLALQELTTELTQQHDASRAFMKTLLTNVLTPFQEARCYSLAYPHWPDALMLSRLAAEELGDPSAHAQLLDLGPPAPPAGLPEAARPGALTAQPGPAALPPAALLGQAMPSGC